MKKAIIRIILVILAVLIVLAFVDLAGIEIRP